MGDFWASGSESGTEEAQRPGGEQVESRQCERAEETRGSGSGLGEQGPPRGTSSAFTRLGKGWGVEGAYF